MHADFNIIKISIHASIANCPLALLPNFNIIHVLDYRQLIGTLSTRVFETWTATESDLFSLSTCLHSTTFIVLSTCIFSPLEMISTKI